MKPKFPFKKRIQLIYYTDPVCSSCWVIEPNLRKFRLEYGEYFDFEFRMGGLLPGWDSFHTKNNNVLKPEDVAPNWDELGKYSGMSIDGDVWIEDPILSSDPPCTAFKAVQIQSDVKASLFLRFLREKLFLDKKNITHEKIFLEGVELLGLDRSQFLNDFRNGKGRLAFMKDMNEAKAKGIRSFPTFVFKKAHGNEFSISASSSYKSYITALEKAYGEKIKPRELDYDEVSLIQEFGLLSTKEIAVVLGQYQDTTNSKLQQLCDKGKIYKHPQKYGTFWNSHP